MRFVFVSLLSFAFLALPNAGYADSVPLEGDWSGSGFIKPNTGEKEKVFCKISYNKETNTVYRLRADCASTSIKLVQTGSILKVRDGRYVGDFHNIEYDLSGRVRIVVNGTRQTLTLTSSKGSGSFRLRKRK